MGVQQYPTTGVTEPKQIMASLKDRDHFSVENYPIKVNDGKISYLFIFSIQRNFLQ